MARELNPFSPAGLVALSAYRDAADTDLKTMKKVYNPSASELKALRHPLEESGLLGPNRQLTQNGRIAVEEAFDAIWLDPSVPSQIAIRALVGCAILGSTVTREQLSMQADIRVVTAALVLREITGVRIGQVPSRRAVTEQAVRAIIQEFLESKIEGLRLQAPASVAVKDPILIGVFEAATGYRSFDAGLQRRLNLTLTQSTEARWRRLSKARFEPMGVKVPIPLSRNRADDVVAVVADLSQTASTGWVAIFDAFQAFQKRHRISLNDFKHLVSQLQVEDRLELGPLNVPLMFSEEARAKSALTVGALTFHLARIPK